MRIKVGDAYNLLIALNAIDSHPTTKLSGPTRFAFAVNINVLKPAALAFERARDLSRSGFDALDILSRQASISAADAVLTDKELELALERISKADLRIDDNERVTGQMIAALAPIIMDFDEKKDD
jgi:hypothetical protein